MIKNIKWLLLVSLTFIACNDDEATVTYDSTDGLPLTAGTADFSKYVALGDSFAAGFSDSALFIEGQKGAYPNILAQQFALVGGGAFTTPFMADNIGGFNSGGVQIPQFGPRLYFNGAAPVPVSGISGTSISDKLTGSFNNMGIPGAKSIHLDFSGYGSSAGNPYFARFASTPGATVVTDALAQNPTFFSLWIGGNDVLGYALSGGDGTNPITPTATFNGAYNSIVSKLSTGGRKGVIANIPYVTSLPHFTTVPFNPLTSSVLGKGNVAVGDATIAALNAQLYGPLKQALTAFGAGGRLNLLSATGGNPLLIKDESLTNLSTQLTAAFTTTLGAQTAAAYGAIFGQARQANSSDLVLLTTQSVISSAPTALTSGLGFAPTAPLDKFGITFPLQDKHILIPSEVLELQTATDAYNGIIQAAAAANPDAIAFVDTKSVMDKLSTTGITANNYTVNSTFVTGGAFSLDGFHPTPRGYALIANEFIKAINSKYGSNLNGVNLGNYRILFPRDAANF
jgi:hypothetical protein